MKMRALRFSAVTILAATIGLASASCGKGDESDSGELVAPAGVALKLLPGPAVHLTWADTPSEHHYSIERKTGAEAFKEVGTQVFDKTEYHDADVAAGKSYVYRVAAVGTMDKKSPYSSEVTATVP